MTTQPTSPGCLAALMRLLGFGSPPTGVEGAADTFPYRVRDDFLSPAEQSFFLVLKNILGERYTICPKVSLADIFFVVRPNENMSAYNRINRKHVDFLICEPKTMRPKLGIELDDASHRKANREERDGFVDRVFEAAGLPILHAPARNTYNTGELAGLIDQMMSGTNAANVTAEPGSVPSSQTVDSPQGDAAPVCQKCGVPMVLRLAKTGPRSGQQFYGCPNFPRCREVMPYPI